MDKRDIKAKKGQMIESAQAVVADIQLAGASDRASISASKAAAMTQITQYIQQKTAAATQHSERRKELISQLEGAAKSGDLEEMQRLKQLLSNFQL